MFVVLVRERETIWSVMPFLEGEADEYASKLKAEFDFLGTKYQIKDKGLFLHEWRFLRTRPGNFPSIRLAQFAMFLHKQNSFFFIKKKIKCGMIVL